MTVLFLSLSAGFWAVTSHSIPVYLIWLIFLGMIAVWINYRDLLSFFSQTGKIGAVLVLVSLVQLIFRREGVVLLSILEFPLVYSSGVLEAILFWNRIMILFLLTFLLSSISPFHFLLASRKTGIPLRFSMRLFTALTMIPAIIREGRASLWFFRFRGLQFYELRLKDKCTAVRQILYALLMRNMNMLFKSALALELRGYGQKKAGNIPQPYPLATPDIVLSVIVVALNCVCIVVSGIYAGG